jgi:hypothetical protein
MGTGFCGQQECARHRKKHVPVRYAKVLRTHKDVYWNGFETRGWAEWSRGGPSKFVQSFAASCCVSGKTPPSIIAKEQSFKHSISANPSGGSNQISVVAERADSCPTEEFLGLKNGGPANKWISETILFQSGRTWLEGARWLITEFAQKS